ncbi:MAG TPA: hypothetical protein PK771_05080 [Spirochaetota bacterium]|nr:hypothetical protein [Spirochaetota bacterium]
MNYEIEKKFMVNDFDLMLELLKKDFGDYKLRKKAGFWFANNFTGMEVFLDIEKPLFQKKDVIVIKDIGEFSIPEMDFQYLRLRVVNSQEFIVTFKIKNLVNNIEQNTEYEFEVDKETIVRIYNYIKDNSFIYFYNIKESYEFEKRDLKVELSKFNNLKDSFIEVELTGDNQNVLTKRLEFELGKFKIYNLKEEPRSYMELAMNENRNRLKNVRLSNYSKDAIKDLEKILL